MAIPRRAHDGTSTIGNSIGGVYLVFCFWNQCLIMLGVAEMTLHELLLIQFVLFILLIMGLRVRLRGNWGPLIRTILFVVVLFTFADYMGHSRHMWKLSYGGKLSLFSNPIENTLFCIAMIGHLIAIYEVVEVVTSASPKSPLL